MDQPSQSVTFNIPYDLLPANWQALIEVYKAMPGWVDDTDRDGCPMWWPDGSTVKNLNMLSLDFDIHDV
jgi:hypothetical protein